MAKYFLMIPVMVVVGWAEWTVAPKEKVVYRDKPVTQHYDCNLPLPLGAKGAAVKGDWDGMTGVVAGKIDNPATLACAYYVKYINKDIWNGDGIHYQSVNADNFVGVSR